MPLAVNPSIHLTTNNMILVKLINTENVSMKLDDLADPKTNFATTRVTLLKNGREKHIILPIGATVMFLRGLSAWCSESAVAQQQDVHKHDKLDSSTSGCTQRTTMPAKRRNVLFGL